MSDKDQQTTLAVTKEFAHTLREDFDGSNDMERLNNWAEDKYGYKDSITNEDIVEKLENLDIDLDQESITKAVERALPSSAY